RLQPALWYSQFDFVSAVQQVAPDFQRPNGNYDTWYIRNVHTQEFLKGFEQWDAVEGELLRFMIRGPLHWLALLDIAEPSAGDDLLISLNERSAGWLGLTPAQSPEQSRHTIAIGEDFTLTLSPGIALADRFRIERFAQWQASYPQFVYQINQRMLRRAKEEGISSDQILNFLQSRGAQVPHKVQVALQRHA
ncbi:MAG: hypothetical protein KDE58_02130, partial [Caldilineaceae bacterium]|nr:hypothetical protein [Caldilineaceae bacterium]